MLATAAEKPSLSSSVLSAGAGAATKLGLKFKIPNLRELVTNPGAVAGMLRAIMTALRTRFPAFLGMNVLWSLALFGESYFKLTSLIFSASLGFLVLLQTRSRSPPGKRAPDH